MIERITNTLVVLSVLGVAFIVVALPIVFDTAEATETQQRALHGVTGHVTTASESLTLPDRTPVLEIKASKEAAQESLTSALSIYDTIAAIQPDCYTLEYAGEFYLTMYAATVEQCGNTLGITASGKKVTTNPTCRTCAVDPSVIPLGTYLLIEGYDGIVWQATDTGSAVLGFHIDLFTSSELESLSFPNVSGAKVWIIKDYKGGNND